MEPQETGALPMSQESAHEKLLEKGNKTAITFIYHFAWFWSITAAVYFFAVTFMSLPDGGKDFANIILGFLLGTAVSTIISYFYGSSKE